MENKEGKKEEETEGEDEEESESSYAASSVDAPGADEEEDEGQGGGDKGEEEKNSASSEELEEGDDSDDKEVKPAEVMEADTPEHSKSAESATSESDNVAKQTDETDRSEAESKKGGDGSLGKFLLKECLERFFDFSDEIFEEVGDISVEETFSHILAAKNVGFQEHVAAIRRFIPGGAPSSCLDDVVKHLLSWYDEIVDKFGPDSNSTLNESMLNERRLLVVDDLFSQAMLEFLSTGNSLSQASSASLIDISFSKLRSTQGRLLSPVFVDQVAVLRSQFARLVGLLSRRLFEDVSARFFADCKSSLSGGGEVIIESMAKMSAGFDLPSKGGQARTFSFFTSLLEIFKCTKHNETQLAFIRLLTTLFGELYDGGVFVECCDYTKWSPLLKQFVKAANGVQKKRKDWQATSMVYAILCVSSRDVFRSSVWGAIESLPKLTRDASVRTMVLESLLRLCVAAIEREIDTREGFVLHFTKLFGALFSRAVSTSGVSHLTLQSNDVLERLILCMAYVDLNFALSKVILPILKDSSLRENQLFALRAIHRLLRRSGLFLSPRERETESLRLLLRNIESAELARALSACDVGALLTGILFEVNDVIGDWLKLNMRTQSIDSLLGTRTIQIAIMIETFRCVPMILPTNMSTQLLLSAFAQYTIHLHKGLSAEALAVLRRMIAHFPERRTMVLSCYADFVISIPDQHRAVIVEGLSMLEVLLSDWIGALAGGKDIDAKEKANWDPVFFEKLQSVGLVFLCSVNGSLRGLSLKLLEMVVDLHSALWKMSHPLPTSSTATLITRTATAPKELAASNSIASMGMASNASVSSVSISSALTAVDLGGVLEKRSLEEVGVLHQHALVGSTGHRVDSVLQASVLSVSPVAPDAMLNKGAADEEMMLGSLDIGAQDVSGTKKKKKDQKSRKKGGKRKKKQDHNNAAGAGGASVAAPIGGDDDELSPDSIPLRDPNMPPICAYEVLEETSQKYMIEEVDATSMIAVIDPLASGPPAKLLSHISSLDESGDSLTYLARILGLMFKRLGLQLPGLIARTWRELVSRLTKLQLEHKGDLSKEAGRRIEEERALWRCYVVCACSTISFASSSYTDQPESSPVDFEVEDESLPLSSRELLMYLIPQLGSSNLTVRTAAALGLGHTDSSVREMLLEELVKYEHSALSVFVVSRREEKSKNSLRKRRGLMIRNMLSGIYLRLVTQNQPFSSEHQKLRYFQSVLELKGYIQSTADEVVWGELQQLRFNFCRLVQTVLQHLRSTWNVETRKDFFEFFVSYCGTSPFADGQKKREKAISTLLATSRNSRELQKTLEWQILGVELAASSVLAELLDGPLWDERIDTSSLAVRWILAALQQTGDHAADVRESARRGLKNLLVSNGRALPFVMNVCYSSKESLSRSCFRAVVAAIEVAPMIVTNIPALLNLALLQLADAERVVREAALRCCVVFSESILGEQGQDSLSTFNHTSLVESGLSSSLSRIQLGISSKLASCRPDLAATVFIEMCARLQSCSLIQQGRMLEYVVPWMKCVRFGGDAPEPSQSAAALKNLFAFTQVFITVHPSGLKRLWVAVGQESRDIVGILEFFAVICSQSITTSASHVPGASGSAGAGEGVIPTAKAALNWLARKHPRAVVDLLVKQLDDFSVPIPTTAVAARAAGAHHAARSEIYIPSWHDAAVVLLADFPATRPNECRAVLPRLLHASLLTWDHPFSELSRAAVVLAQNCVRALGDKGLDSFWALYKTIEKHVLWEGEEAAVKVDGSLRDVRDEYSPFGDGGEAPRERPPLHEFLAKLWAVLSPALPNVRVEIADQALRGAGRVQDTALVCRALMLCRAIAVPVQENSLYDLLSFIEGFLDDPSSDETVGAELLRCLQTQIESCSEISMFPHFYWACVALLSMDDYQLFPFVSRALGALLCRLPRDDCALVERTVLEGKPEGWTVEFNGVLPMVIRGLLRVESAVAAAECLSRSLECPFSALIVSAERQSRFISTLAALLPWVSRSMRVGRSTTSVLDNLVSGAKEAGLTEVVEILRELSRGVGNAEIFSDLFSSIARHLSMEQTVFVFQLYLEMLKTYPKNWQTDVVQLLLVLCKVLPRDVIRKALTVVPYHAWDSVLDASLMVSEGDEDLHEKAIDLLALVASVSELPESQGSTVSSGDDGTSPLPSPVEIQVLLALDTDADAKSGSALRGSRSGARSLIGEVIRSIRPVSEGLEPGRRPSLSVGGPGARSYSAALEYGPRDRGRSSSIGRHNSHELMLSSQTLDDQLGSLLEESKDFKRGRHAQPAKMDSSDSESSDQERGTPILLPNEYGGGGSRRGVSTGSPHRVRSFGSFDSKPSGFGQSGKRRRSESGERNGRRGSVEGDGDNSSSRALARGSGQRHSDDEAVGKSEDLSYAGTEFTEFSDLMSSDGEDY